VVQVGAQLWVAVALGVVSAVSRFRPSKAAPWVLPRGSVRPVRLPFLSWLKLLVPPSGSTTPVSRLALS
jgi:hypothetical protein